MKGRREFLTFVGATAAWPFAAQAQQGVPLVAFLSGRSHAESGPVLEEFKKGLAENGFADGRNLRFEYRWAEGHYSQLPNLAAELVELRPRVIVTTGGNVTALAAKAATASIPIIFAAGGDPIKSGLVDSLSRPGGNATGVSLYIAELAPKRLQFLLEIVPRAKRIGVISNPDNPTGVAETKEVNSHATSLGLTVEILSVRGAGDLEKSFSLSSGNIEAVFVTNDPFIVDLRDQLVKIAASRRVPTIYFSRDFVEAGGLMSYGSSIGDGYRKVAQYVSQVLLGARPADLPVQQPTKFELIVNLKTAKLLGLELSPTLLARADEVIE